MLKAFSSVVLILCLAVSGEALAEEATVVISATEWEPYTGASLPDGGFLTEITEKALESRNRKVRFEFVPWKRALEMTRVGEYDAIIGASWTEERTEYLRYPAYFWESSIAFFSRKDRPATYPSTEALCPATVGILRGSLFVKRFTEIGCFNIQPGNSVETNIRKLLGNRLDLMIESDISVSFYLNRKFPDRIHDVQMLRPVIQEDKVYCAFSKAKPGHKALAEDYDEGIKLIRQNGVYDGILSKHGMSKL